MALSERICNTAPTVRTGTCNASAPLAKKGGSNDFRKSTGETKDITAVLYKSTSPTHEQASTGKSNLNWSVPSQKLRANRAAGINTREEIKPVMADAMPIGGFMDNN